MAALAKTATSDMAGELIAQAVASIEAADHFSFPLPHILFRNFFPADFYRDLVRSIPAEDTIRSPEREREWRCVSMATMSNRSTRNCAPHGLRVRHADLEGGRESDPHQTQ
jgi:hypothetical protein